MTSTAVLTCAEPPSLADAWLVPDPQALVGAFHDAFAELREAPEAPRPA